MELLREHAYELVSSFLAFLWVVVRLTPSKNDNDIISLLMKVINVLIPNRKKGGGRH